MKIAFLAGADSIHTIKWVNSLVARGHEVHLLSLPNHSNTNCLDSLSPNIIIHYLPFKGALGYFINARKAKNIICQIEPDLVNAHYASGYGTMARLIGFHPTLISVWGSDVYIFPWKSLIHRYLLKGNICFADGIASTTYAMVIQVKRIVDYKKTIFITPFGINTNYFKKDDMNDFINRETILIGTVKLLKPGYGIKYLLEAVNILLNKLEIEQRSDLKRRIRVKIYGDGVQLKDLMAISEKLGLNHIVNFEGYIQNDNVPSVLNEFDIFCAPSIVNESFGVSLVEAMACELPVVATDTDGFKEVIGDSGCGFIVKKADANEMAEKLYELVINPELRVKMGIDGRLRATTMYDWENNVLEMESAYRNLINSKKLYSK